MSDTHKATDRYTVDAALERYHERTTGRAFSIPVWNLIDTDADTLTSSHLTRSAALAAAARLNGQTTQEQQS